MIEKWKHGFSLHASGWWPSLATIINPPAAVSFTACSFAKHHTSATQNRSGNSPGALLIFASSHTWPRDVEYLARDGYAQMLPLSLCLAHTFGNGEPRRRDCWSPRTLSPPPSLPAPPLSERISRLRSFVSYHDHHHATAKEARFDFYARGVIIFRPRTPRVGLEASGYGRPDGLDNHNIKHSRHHDRVSPPPLTPLPSIVP